MNTDSLGNSQLKVTPLGLGLAALGRPGYINLGHSRDLPASHDLEEMREHSHRILDVAWNAGVRYFDAARSYGRAEDLLGTWLASREIAPDEVTIGSKWGYTYTADWRTQVEAGEQHEVKEHTLPVLDRQIAESREALGTQLNLYQIHSATLESGVFQNDEVIDRLAELRDSGLTIGFSTSGPKQADTIRKGISIQRGGEPVFGSVQATWNMLEPSAGDALAEASEAGCGVIIKEGLANGRLTSRNSDPDFRKQMGPLLRLAKELDTSIDAVALALAIQQRWSNVVLSGAATVEHLRSNLDAIRLVDQIQFDELLTLSEPAEQYWATRSGLAWN